MEINLPDIFKSIIWDTLIKVALADALSALGLSASGPLGMLVAYFFLKTSNFIYARLKLTVDLAAIVIKDDAHKKAFSDAQIKLYLIAREKGTDSEEFKNAHEKERDAFFDLIHFDSDPLILHDGKNP